MVKQLYSVGHLLNNKQIDGSLKQKIENIQIDVEPGIYIKFENLKFEAKKDAENSTQIKDAVINKKSILTKIYADIVRYEHGRREVVIKNLIIGHVPQLLEGRNSFIVNGTEYNIVNQLRRNPSSYITLDSNNNIFADFNLSKGRNFHITLDPVSNKFYVEIGTSRVIIKALLHALDVYPQEFKAAVGEKLYQINWTNVTQTELNRNYYKLYSKLYEFRKERVRDLPLSHVMSEVKDYYKNNTKVDSHTTRYLYNVDSERVDKQLVIETLKKYKDVIEEKENPVDVDDLYYQRLYTPNLLFVDRVDKLLPELKNKIKFKLKNKDRYDSTFKNFFSKPLVSLVNSSNLSRLDPQYNPLGIYSSGTTVTPLGMGGINDISAVRKGSRGVHNSHMGVIDPIASPQGQNAGVQLKLTDDVKVDEEGKIHIPLKDKNGSTKYYYIGDTFNKKILLPGQNLKTSKEVSMLYRGKIITTKNKNDWDLEFAKGSESLLNDLDKLIPMANAVQGNRNYMSFRFFTQALPLLYKQKIDVTPVNNKGESTYKALRRKLEKFIPLTAPISGTVRTIRDNKLIIRDGDNKDHEVSYHKHLPLATNTGLHQRPTVRVGDKVKKGDIIFKDPYTSKDGELAIGVNMKSAYTPYYGENAEDAVVISESAAKKLTSVHYYTYTIALDDTKIVDKTQFLNLFSNKYEQSQLDKLDSDGVIKVNSEVSYGDPIIGCIQKRSPDDKLNKIGKISKKIIIDLKDGSEKYDKNTKGEVIEVKKSGKLITVIVKTFEPAVIGDKVAGAYGNKGVISCFQGLSEVYTKKGWKKWEDVSYDDELACMVEGETFFSRPDKLFKEVYKNGEMIHVKNSRQLNYMVTPNHQMYVRTEGSKIFKKEFAEDIFNKRRIHLAEIPKFNSYNLENNEYKIDILDLLPKGINNPKKHNTIFYKKDLAEFIGWYIAEGWCRDNKSILLSQCCYINKDKYRKIQLLLNRMGLINSYNKKDIRFSISNTPLYELLKPYNESSNKKLPAWVFEKLNIIDLEEMFNALILGDGYKTYKKNGIAIEYATVSKQLAKDVDRLCILLGYNTKVSTYQPQGDRKRVYRVRNITQKTLCQRPTKKCTFEKVKNLGDYVYCAEVPGNLLLVKNETGNPIWIGNCIIPDDKILQDEEGKPIDVVWSSTVVVSRINPAQVFENSLGKIVRKGKRKRYDIPLLENPEGKPLYEYVKDELKKHGVKDKEKVFDPRSGKHIDNPIAVGSMYTLKLLKGDKDITARGVGPFYTSNLTPAKGGKEGAKAIGMAEFYGLVGHNARHTLSEMSSIKSQYNPEFFKNFELGLTTPIDKNSFTWDKTKAMLTAAGGHIDQTPNGHIVVPLTDKLTRALAGHRTIKTPALLKSKSLEPVKKGLFDKNIVGGLDGKLWSKIDLHDGIVSPLVADYIRLTLDMRKEEFENWQNEGSTRSLKKDLDNVNVEDLLATMQKKSKTNDLNNNEMKVYKFLSNLKEKDIKLSDLVITSIPVPPPVYRPITQLENGDIQLADINNFYKDVMLANDGLEGLAGSTFKGEAKATLVDSINALIGKTQTKNVQLQRKGAKGILSYVGGVGSPKNGFVHSSMIKKNQDMSGRARIIPDAKMDMDTIGVPEKMAWKLYTPHIRKSLIAAGYSSSEADDMIEKHDSTARQHMQQIMDKTPVWYNRAPTLSRFGFLAGKPKLIPGNSLKINMFSTGPLNADFDGDAIQVHVPVTDAASREAEKYLLSKLIFNDADLNKLNVGLTVESVLGFYQMGEKDPKKLREDIYNITKPKRYEIKLPFNKKSINKLLLDIAKEQPNKVNEIYTKLKLLSEDYATAIGSTVGIEDVTPNTKKVNSLLRKYKPQINTAKDRTTQVKLLEKLQQEMVSLAADHVGDLADMVRAGAKGKDNQLASMLTSPTIAYDPDRPFQTATLTEGNFAGGLNIKDFWQQNAKARKDLVNTALAVATPGALNKLVIASVNKEIISEEDCGTKRGIRIDSSSPDIYGRVLQQTTPKLNRNTIITSDNAGKLPKGLVIVRSPQTCESINGICQKCYGIDSNGKFPEIGVNIGVRAAHSISEPLAQMALDSKHGGRSISKDVGAGGLTEMMKLLSSDTKKPEIAVIAEDEGYIENIEELPSGNYEITTDTGVKYNAHRDATLLVRQGQEIAKGDKLTEGVIPFTKMVELKGINAGRKALTDEMNRIMKQNGKRVHSRLNEIVGKAAVNYIEIMSPWEMWDIGDTVPYNIFAGKCEEKGVEMNVSLLEEGMYLAEEVLDLSCGHELTVSDISKIRREYKRIKILPKGVRVRPITRSLYTAGLTDDDWVNHLGLRYIKKGIIGAAATGIESADESTSPMVKWIKGRQFKPFGANY